MKTPLLVLPLAVSLSLLSCESSKKAPPAAPTEPVTTAKPAVAKPTAPKKKKPVSKRYIGSKTGYRKNAELWDTSKKTLKTDAQRRLVIDTKTQRGKLYAGDDLVMDFPVTTGKSGKRTPKGSFSTTEKIVNKRSNIYGTKMPYWMRFNGAIGIHAGRLHSRPASNGCVRVPTSVAPVLYKNMPKGTKIEVQ